METRNGRCFVLAPSRQAIGQEGRRIVAGTCKMPGLGYTGRSRLVGCVVTRLGPRIDKGEAEWLGYSTTILLPMLKPFFHRFMTLARHGWSGGRERTAGLAPVGLLVNDQSKRSCRSSRSRGRHACTAAGSGPARWPSVVR